ncbi:MAG: type II secretion system minor pseudopilin GspK [Brachymonas sp.]|jgi:general secretion pathway protein K
MMSARRFRQRERGAAILLAMLIVVLVATAAAGTLWRQAQVMAVEAAERDRAQAAWVLNGLLDWARIIVREDDRPSGNNSSPRRVDYLDEPWAKELKASSLAAFLALDKNDSGGRDTQDLNEAFFSGRIEDQNSKFNLPDLLADDLKGFDSHYEAVFNRLCSLLSIPDAERDYFKAAYLRAARAKAGRGSEDLPANIAQMLQRPRPGGDEAAQDEETKSEDALFPMSLEQLAWLGASTATLDRLRPYLVIFLPTRIDQARTRQSININTADAIMLKAAIDGCDDNCAQQIRQMSLSSGIKGFDSATQLFAQTAFKSLAERNASAPISGTSQLFKVMGKLQVNRLMVEEIAVIWRPNPGDATVYTRERAALGNFIDEGADSQALGADDLAALYQREQGNGGP